MTADLILTNAAVITMDPQQPHAEAVAVAGERILAIGRAAEIESLRGPRSEIIDCGGRAVIPGIVDAHIHLLAYAASLVSLDCSPEAARSIADIQAAVRQRAAALPQGTWIRAVGYDETALAERRHPNRHDLDLAAPDHPVRLLHRTGHAVVLNTLALRLVGITNETEEPPGGSIDRDLTTGEPTGLLFEMKEMVDRVVPPLSEVELHAAVTEASRRLLAEGVTTIQDATPTNGASEQQLFQRLIDAGCLSQRVLLMEGYEHFAGAAEPLSPSLSPPQGEGGIYAPPRVGEGLGGGSAEPRFGPVKIMLRELGDELWPPLTPLTEMVRQVHIHGRQVAVHAIGQQAVTAASTAIEQALVALPRRDHRHRIEHCGVCPPDLAQRLGRLGVVVVTQPAFLYYHGDRYLREVPHRDLPHLYPLWRLEQAGVSVASSSDAPVVSPALAPRLTGVVERRSRGGAYLTPEERLDMAEALRMATVTAAYTGRWEGQVGRIAGNYAADLVVLSAHPFLTPTEQLRELRVEVTVLAGRVQYMRQ